MVGQLHHGWPATSGLASYIWVGQLHPGWPATSATSRLASYRLGWIIPVFPPTYNSFPKTSHYSHNLVPIIIELFSIQAAKDTQQ